MRALLVIVVLAMPARAEAWNPIKAAADKAAAAGRVIGGVLGAPAAGFIEAAATPVIDSVEDAGHRLIRDADRAIADNLARTGALISQTGETAHSVLGDVDRSLAARIVQVTTGIDHSVDHVFDRLDHTLGELDKAADGLLVRAGQLIQKVDAIATRKLAELDRQLALRIRDVQLVVSSAIQQADDAARERLAQLDELAGRRLGNLDVIVSKQSLGIEDMVGRIATLISLIGLFAFVAWRGFRELATALSTTDEQRARRGRAVLRLSLPRLVPQIALAVGGVLGLKLLAEHLPRDSERRSCELIAQHDTAFAAAVHAFDVSEARYHESQLEILVPGNITGYRAQLKKTELLHSVFTRPGQLRSQHGLAALVAEVAEVEAAVGTGDPDLQIAKAYVLWQVGGTRDDEYDAATLCANALRTGGALLAPLARNYIAMFLARPYRPRNASAAELAELAKLAAQPTATREITQFDRVIEFDRRVLDLDRASSAAYLDMLAAHADLQIALPRGARSSAVLAARAARSAAAERLIEAWRTFDAALASSPALAGDAIALSVFALDDAVLTRARYYAAQPMANDIAPTLTGDSGQSLAADVRARIAPLRVAWERRYGALLGPSERDVVAYQETERFAGFERRARAFEQAYVAFLVAAHSGAAAPKLVELATLAATCASHMGLYRATPSGLATEASSILAIAHAHGGDVDPTAVATIDLNYQVRRLRLL
ncbi:MAG TPA: hypothetical protein VIX73_33620 [Kofleriaceae bacterium]